MLRDELFYRLDDIEICGVCHICLVVLRRFLESFGIDLRNFLSKVAGFKSLCFYWPVLNFTKLTKILSQVLVF